MHVATREPDYGDLRKLWLNSLVLQLRHQRREPFRTPVEHYTILVEPDRHRDPDNVYAGSMKLIWDALVMAGLLTTDGARHVGRSRGWEMLYHPGGAGVYLKLYEPDAPHWESTGLQFAGRLPDNNELLHARELGARRGVRYG